MSQLPTDNLASLIRKKHQILVQLRSIGQKQQATSEDSAVAAMLQLMGAKQHLINALELVERNLRPYQTEDPELRVWRTPEDRANCAKQAQECTSLLAEVMELEKNQEQRMVDRRNDVAKQLQQSTASRDAAGAYHQHRTTHAKHQATPPLTGLSGHPGGEVSQPGLDIASEAS